MKLTLKLTAIFCLCQVVVCPDVSLPKTIEALSAQCVVIPCTFETESSYNVPLQPAPAGIWIKNERWKGERVFNSSKSSGNKIRAKITGDLSRKNCTTIFYTISENDQDKYYFRIESETSKMTFESHVFVNVSGSPSSPSLKLYKDQEEVKETEMLEGSSVSLLCSAETFCPSKPPTLTWSILPLNILNPNIDITSSNLNFIASYQHNNLTFTCTATYLLENNVEQSAKTSLTLHVQYAPKNVRVSASQSGPVILGSSVSLSCSSDANPAVLNYTWYRENGEQIGSEAHLTINKTNTTHSGLYYCRAQNQHGAQNSSLLLDIQYVPQISLSSSCNSSNDEMLVCFCEVYGSPSPKMEWLMHGQVILPSSKDLSITEETVGKTGIRSYITIRQSLTGTSSLQCVGRNTLGTSKQLFFIKFTTSGLHVRSLLIGAAVGASAVMILCFIYLCKRRTKHKPSSSAKDNTAGLVSNVRNATFNLTFDKEEDDDSVYTNNPILSPNQELSQSIPDSLHYTTINFPKGGGDTGQIIGLSSLTSDYATIQHHTGDEMKDENAGGEDSRSAGVGQKKQPNLNKKREKPFQLTEEEAMYSNVRHHTVPAQPNTSEEVKQVRARANHPRRDK